MDWNNEKDIMVRYHQLPFLGIFSTCRAHANYSLYLMYRCSQRWTDLDYNNATSWAMSFHYGPSQACQLFMSVALTKTDMDSASRHSVEGWENCHDFFTVLKFDLRMFSPRALWFNVSDHLIHAALSISSFFTIFFCSVTVLFIVLFLH